MIAVELQHHQAWQLRAIITASASEPGRFQLTWADERGPSGHTTRDTSEQAIDLAIAEGYRVVISAAPEEAAHTVAKAIEVRDRRLAEIEAMGLLRPIAG